MRPAGLRTDDAAPLLWHPDGSGSSDGPSLSPLQLDVRGVRPWDLAALARVPLVLRLNQPELSLSAYGPLRVSVSAMQGWRRQRPKLFVACVGGRLVGFAHLQPVLPDRRWQLIALGAATGVYDAAPVWEELMRRATTAAGLRGVKRLYARVPIGSPAAEPLRRLGFTAYATETVVVAQQLRSAPTKVALRAQEQTDTWAIHQLYSATVPRQVQYAEALTSHRWDLHGNAVTSDLTTVGWLIEEGHQLLGYVRVSSRGANHAIQVISEPNHVEILDDLIDGVIARLRARTRVDRVYCALRGYQAEVVSAIAERGFDPVLEQELFIKYTTASARVPQFESVPFHADVIEKLPKRVPSFLHGPTSDESTT